MKSKVLVALLVVLSLMAAISRAVEPVIGYWGEMPQNAGREIWTHAVRFGVKDPRYEVFANWGSATSRQAPIKGLRVDFVQFGFAAKVVSEERGIAILVAPYYSKLVEFSDTYGVEARGGWYPDPEGKLALRAIFGASLAMEQKTPTRPLIAEDAKAYRLGGGLSYDALSLTLGYAEWWAVRSGTETATRGLRGPFVGLEVHWPLGLDTVTRLTAERGKLTTHDEGLVGVRRQTVVTGSVAVNFTKADFDRVFGSED